MSEKRPALSQTELRERSAKTARTTARLKSSVQNPFLAHPIDPVKDIQGFLIRVQREARRCLAPDQYNKRIDRPCLEVEARLGILNVSHAHRRVTSSGAQCVSAKAFNCSGFASKCHFIAGVSRAHFMRNTATRLSLVSALTRALDATQAETLKNELQETCSIETVYTYPNNIRIVFDGEQHGQNRVTGRKELKKSLCNLDLSIPAAKYDLRVSLKTEKPAGSNVPLQHGWTSKRVKVRRSYKRKKEQGSYWQIDVTEVTTTKAGGMAPSGNFEIEVELIPGALVKLVNEHNNEQLQARAAKYAEQLWQILFQLNPLHEELDVESKLELHPDANAVQQALERLAFLEKFLSDQPNTPYQAPTPTSHGSPTFPGSMPINFARHHLETILRLPTNAYFLSEKTDGQRFLAVFLEKTVVLVDRQMRGKQPIPVGDNNKTNSDPFGRIRKMIQTGTVLEGEVVMNRHKGQQPRPVFIVFDVLAICARTPVLHLNFEQRLQELKAASFRTNAAKEKNVDVFADSIVLDENIALPLMRKEFFNRCECHCLLSRVSEQHGMRIYKVPGTLQNHLTDGIIFQPNLPYYCRTDRSLLKWKYLDTVTVDVRLLTDNNNLGDTQDDAELPCECFVGGARNPRIDMTTHIRLPKSERLRLEADRFESGGEIAEVGFDAEIGEYYYHTMRPDKGAPNRIQTILGSFGELAESISAEELRFRLSVPLGGDTYWRDVQKMMKSMRDHHSQVLKDYPQEDRKTAVAKINRP